MGPMLSLFTVMARGPFDWRAAAILAGVFLAPCIILLPAAACAPTLEQRKNCTVQVDPHPTLPYPAGVIVVTCDGLERARIVARRAYAQH
jgi:hypothetical protein